MDKDFALKLAAEIGLDAQQVTREELNLNGISKEKFLEDVSLLSEVIELKDTSLDFENRAKSLISHETDIPFLALALELDIPLWSNDPHFKQQSLVKVFTTEELIKVLSSRDVL